MNITPEGVTHDLKPRASSGAMDGYKPAADRAAQKVFSPSRRCPAYLQDMLEDLKLGPAYDGFLFLAESVRNPPVLRPHHHVELELNLVRSGEITYVVEGERVTFGRHSLLWLFPEQEHQLVDRTSDAQYYVAVFKPELIRSACRSERYSLLKRKRPANSAVLHTELAPDAYEHVRLAMDALLEDGLDPDVLNREAGFGLSPSFHFEHRDPDWLNAGLRHLLLLCSRCQAASTERKHGQQLHACVREALEEMRKPDAPDDLESLAAACGVSASYLSRTFHKQVGVPLTRYRNSVRLSRFWEVWRRPSVTTLLEAVYEAGFGSYAQFYRVYTAAYGKSPARNLRRPPAPP